MTTWIALLRAVNVGGTGTLLMRDLRAICAAAGFRATRTHGASGNAIFEAHDDEATVKAELGRRLELHMGQAPDILLRTAGELTEVLSTNPFPIADPSRVVAIFLDAPPGPDAFLSVTGRDRENLALGRRELFVHYPDGMGRSRLRIPAARGGTARNLNTIARLVGAAAKA